MSNTTLNWVAIESDPKFQALHKKKSMFLWGLMFFATIYYFMLPIGAAYFQELYKVKVWGVVNVGLLFALSEFVVAWGIAWVYARKANAEFDLLTEELNKRASMIGEKHVSRTDDEVDSSTTEFDPLLNKHAHAVGVK